MTPDRGRRPRELEPPNPTSGCAWVDQRRSIHRWDGHPRGPWRSARPAASAFVNSLGTSVGLHVPAPPGTESPLSSELAIIRWGSAIMARLFDQVEHLLERVLETPGRL